MRSLILAGTLLIASPASANLLSEMSPAEKWNEAEAVVIAVPEKCPANLEARCTMRILAVLKGNVPRAFAFARRTHISEETAWGCCRHRHIYLGYLRRWDGVWYLVNGHYGIIDLTAASAAKQ